MSETFDCAHCGTTHPRSEAEASTEDGERLCGECVRAATAADRQPRPTNPTRES